MDNNMIICWMSIFAAIPFLLLMFVAFVFNLDTKYNLRDKPFFIGSGLAILYHFAIEPVIFYCISVPEDMIFVKFMSGFFIIPLIPVQVTFMAICGFFIISKEKTIKFRQKQYDRIKLKKEHSKKHELYSGMVSNPEYDNFDGALSVPEYSDLEGALSIEK